MTSVGGLDNLKRCLAQRRGVLGRYGACVRAGSAARRDHPGRSRLRQEHVYARHRWRMEVAAREIRHCGSLRQIYWRD